MLADFGPEAVQIRLSGGEPTLHPDFFRILDAASSYDAQVTVFTNGRWVDPGGFVEQLRRRHQQGGLLVSLHGASAESHEAFSGVTGSFEETVANILLAVDEGIQLALCTVITCHNLGELEEIVEMGRQLGAEHVAFNRYLGYPLPDIEPAPEEMSAAVSTIERLIREGHPVKYGVGIPQCFTTNSSTGCLAGVAYIAIDPWGRARPCAHSPTVAGSLLEIPLYTLWHGAAMNAWRALTPRECTACAAYAVCHGGCRAVREIRPARRGPLRGEPISDYCPPAKVFEIPADVQPRADVRLRPEAFGYVLLGRGRVVPLSEEARPVIEACDGSATFAQLAARFGQSGLNLLGDLWAMGVLEAA
jgi:radical SAM protein with 4Fe4S-binding SPASM domain